MLRSTTPLLSSFMCLIISSHFSSEHRAEITSCQHHLRPWKFLVLSMNIRVLSVPLQFCLGTQTSTHINTSTGTSNGTHSSSSPQFFCLSCSLSGHILFCDHAVQKKKKKNSIISKFHWNFITHIVIFLQSNNGKGPVSIPPYILF